MKVELGELSFDPIEPTDFRLAIEGASGTGKTNTIACILEDLVEVNIPTLVVERLGVLASLRQKAPNLILVSNNDEADLTIPLEELNIIGELILDKGLKIMLDIQSYKDIASEEYEAHAAAARALKGLYDRAQERFKQGKRRKCLLVVDEVHLLAPERSSDQVDRSNQAVKRSLGVLTRLATEGGNLGINQIVAYQRRAMTIKTIVTQFTDKIIHRLHSVDRKQAAREIGISKEGIRDLAIGEAFIYGDFTDHRVIGPTKIRRRETPDPREESFELVEPPADIKKILRNIQKQVKKREDERKEREDELERLRMKVARLEEKNKELQEKAHIKEGLLDLLESSGKEPSPEIQSRLEKLEEISEKLERKEKRLDQLRVKNEGLEKELKEKTSRIEELEARLAESEDLSHRLENIKPSIREIADVLGVGFDAEEINEDLANENEELRKRIQELENKVEKVGEQEVKIPRDKLEFLQDKRTQEYIDQISEKTPTNVSKRSIRKILLALANSDEPLSREEIQRTAGYSEAVVRGTLNYLKEKRLLALHKTEEGKVYDIPPENMDEIIELKERQRHIEKLEEQLA